MSFQVHVVDAPMPFPCRQDQTVLAAMSGAGQHCVQIGCRSGGCGVCRVQVLEGHFECGTMSRAQVAAPDLECGIALACQLFPRSDLRLRVLGKLSNASSEASAWIQALGAVSMPARRA